MENKNFEIITKKTDERILMCIDIELQKLEDVSEDERIKAHIHNRRSALKEFFEGNFDDNIEFINSCHEKIYQPDNSSSYFSKKALDRIMKERIYNRLSTLYKSVSDCSDLGKQQYYQELSLIIDRQIALEKIFDNFDNSLAILEKHNKHLSSFEDEGR